MAVYYPMIAHVRYLEDLLEKMSGPPEEDFLVYATTFKEAAEIIDEYCGDCIDFVSFEQISEGLVSLVPEQIEDMRKKEDEI